MSSLPVKMSTRQLGQLQRIVQELDQLEREKDILSKKINVFIDKQKLATVKERIVRLTKKDKN